MHLTSPSRFSFLSHFVECLSRWLEAQVGEAGLLTGLWSAWHVPQSSGVRGYMGCSSEAATDVEMGCEELTRSAGGLMRCVGKPVSVQTWDLGLTLKSGFPSVSSE